MSEQILEQLVEEVKNIKNKMASKDDLAAMASKDDLAAMASKNDLDQMATKDDLNSLATKSDLVELERKIDRNHKQIAKNTESLHTLTKDFPRHEKIIETLSLRSNEHDSEIRALKLR
ncbi:hypothetical protein WMZ97_05525 [Lentibacillus sp. N15]|uniref:hypothetical protein n=1 Tax=Lentibacillus songyuanensis TaxID=3136161 RepID=UPI0031BB5446